jgi:hypothetical protein
MLQEYPLEMQIVNDCIKKDESKRPSAKKLLEILNTKFNDKFKDYLKQDLDFWEVNNFYNSFTFSNFNEIENIKSLPNKKELYNVILREELILSKKKEEIEQLQKKLSEFKSKIK